MKMQIQMLLKKNEKKEREIHRKEGGRQKETEGEVALWVVKVSINFYNVLW